MNSTKACKGVALIFLLWHHLFYQHPEFGFFIHSTAVLAKVCVAIFVILSGYGYSESVKFKNVGLFEFYKNRFIVIYSNYWFIALIFVSIGVLFMDRTLQSAFSSHAYAKFIIQMTGLHRFAYSELGYNETWWYMSVIIPLIVLFPFIYDLIRKYSLFLLFLLLVLLIPNKAGIPVINEWILPFALGVFLSQRDYISAISRHLSTFGWWRFFILFMAITLIAAFRSYSPLLSGTKIDWLFGFLIILFVFELTMKSKIIEKLLSMLGGHLFNVFLFHTFIFYYYWESFVYSFSQPVLILIVLLSLCVTISIALEYLKKLLGFYWVIEKVKSLKMPFSMEIPFQKDAPADVRTSRR